MSLLRDVNPEKTLRLKNKKLVKNLYELGSELAEMDAETFTHHVNDDKNDFYHWVLHEVGDEYLARVLSEIKDRRLMFAAVEKRIEQLEAQRMPFHFTARDYLLGIIVGALAMLMLSRIL